jgi:hypothetical protein
METTCKKNGKQQDTKTDYSIQAYGNENLGRSLQRWHETIRGHIADYLRG